jgi:hypothetical protein
LKTWWLEECRHWGLPCDTTSEGFWAMIGAGGTVAAAFLTFLAVSISLWQSWKAMQDGKAKVKIDIKTNTREYEDEDGSTFLRFEFVNLSEKPIVISYVSLLLPNKEEIFSESDRRRVGYGQRTVVEFSVSGIFATLERKGFKLIKKIPKLLRFSKQRRDNPFKSIDKKVKLTIVFEDIHQNQFKKNFSFDMKKWEDEMYEYQY